MPNLKIRISNTLGLHARPAARLAALAGEFDSEILITRGDTVVNAKSILGLMMLAASHGTALTVQINGPDESQALRRFAEYCEREFELLRGVTGSCPDPA